MNLKAYHEYALLLGWVCPCGAAHTDQELRFGALACDCGRVWRVATQVAITYEEKPERVVFRSSRPVKAIEREIAR